VVHLPSLSHPGAAVEAQRLRGAVGGRVQWCRQVDDLPYRAAIGRNGLLENRVPISWIWCHSKGDGLKRVSCPSRSLALQAGSGGDAFASGIWEIADADGGGDSLLWS
jgi:hypothetical protein